MDMDQDPNLTLIERSYSLITVIPELKRFPDVLLDQYHALPPKIIEMVVRAIAIDMHQQRSLADHQCARIISCPRLERSHA